MRTGPVAGVMPKPSNQARTAGVERRVRIVERARTGSSADRIEVALAVVLGAEGDQPEVAVLQGRGGAQQFRDLVDQLLVVTPEIRRHPDILAHAPPAFIHLSEIRGTDA
ncbi:hypothetical protein SFUMM280S_02464 [Streptomyces fumanus]